MVEISFDFSRKLIVEFLPTHASPAVRKTEFGQGVHHVDLQPVGGGDCLGRLHRPGEGGCDHRSYRTTRQEGSRLLRLSSATAAQDKFLEIGVHDVIRILDFAVPDEIHLAEHGR